MEIIKIIEGYNSEKQILTEKITSEDVVKNYAYDGRKEFVKDSRTRIKEIDQLLLEIKQSFLKKTE